MKKLSNRQQEVMDLLEQGWELGSSYGGWHNYCRMQEGGLGYGGKTKTINRNTTLSLVKRGLIVRLPRRKKDSFDLVRYGLKEAK